MHWYIDIEVLNLSIKNFQDLKISQMTEAFLHYVWQFQYFNKANLYTSAGEPVNIIHQGMLNVNAGPDFEQARIKIAEVDWVGSVEIHINAEGWNDHHHDKDAAYENVILHVVWDNHNTIVRKDGSVLPTLVLKDRVEKALYEKYLQIIKNPNDIPCNAQLSKVTDIVKVSMLDKTVAERLELKSKALKKIFDKNLGDWEETAYQALLTNFGFKVNNEPFQQLAIALPYKLIRKHIGQQLQIESLLLGMAGLLPEQIEDEYLQHLQREYALLSHKYDLQTRQLNIAQWRLMRLRPANFPAIRLMQLASLLQNFGPLFSGFVEFSDYKELYNKLRVKQSDYWTKHYLPGKKSTVTIPGLGKASIENIIINTVVPLLVLYSNERDEQAYMDKALDVLQHIKAENNRIIRSWHSVGWKVKNAFDSQALIGLYNNYCLKRRCLQCNIGSNLVRP